MNIPAYLWHPIAVHFSVALLSIATLFYVLAALFPRADRRVTWILFARWNLWGGSGLSVLTALLGWLAYNTVSHDGPSHDAMQVHAILALITLTAFGGLALWVALRRRAKEEPSFIFTLCMLVAFAFLVATGLRGGELVFHYGLAVDSLPKPEADTLQSSPIVPIEPETIEKPVTKPHQHHHNHGTKKAE